MTTVLKRCINRLMKGYRRNNQGQFVKVPFSQSKFGGLFLLILTVSLGAIIDWLYSPVELARPISGSIAVHAVEQAPQPTTAPLTVKDKIMQAWGPVEGPLAVKVAFCESSLNPEAAHTHSSARGLFQIIRGTWNGYKCEGDPLIAEDNIACAYKIYQANGWDSTASWHASSNCWKGAK